MADCDTTTRISSRPTKRFVTLTIGISIAVVHLTKGKFCIIDSSDLELVCERCWHAVPARSKWKNYYAVGDIDESTVPMHRVLTNAPPDKYVDHVNGNGLDNRRENLRIATRLQNGQNRRSNVGREGLKGVHERRLKNRTVWIAKIGNGGKNYLGTFDSRDDAIAAYDIAAKEMWGEFAQPNRTRSAGEMLPSRRKQLRKNLPVSIGGVTYQNRSMAAKAFGVGDTAIGKWVKKGKAEVIY